MTVATAAAGVDRQAAHVFQNVVALLFGGAYLRQSLELARTLARQA
jgi:hypothetical protein